jgi:MFS-type transporter involved in bile tolerance (Atg22 family)
MHHHHHHHHHSSTNSVVPPIEAIGLTYNSIARGDVSMSTLFLGPALLKLAKEAAALNNNDDDDDDSNDDEGRIYGIKPTSLLTNIGVFSGLLSCMLTPLFGAVVDYTPHRKLVGQVSSITLSFVKGIEILINEHTWFFISILQVLNFVLYNAYLVATYAYTAELSGVPDEQTRYNSQFQTIYYTSMLLFLVVVTAASSTLGVGGVGTARISQTIAFVMGLGIFTLSWKYYFHPRPALRDIPPPSSQGSTTTSLIAFGFTTLSSTFSRIWRSDEWYALRYFLLSVSLSEAATSALSTISTTYMIQVLKMDASQIGIVFLCVFLAGIPGSELGGMIGIAINPLRSACLCLAIFSLNTLVAAIVLNGPEDRIAMYGFAAVWGVCLAWLHPTHASLCCTIIPKGQDYTDKSDGNFALEIVAFLILRSFSSVLYFTVTFPAHGHLLVFWIVPAWFPPLLFTFLNEVGASMMIGLITEFVLCWRIHPSA